MKIYVDILDNKKRLIVQEGENKFIIGFYGSDLYWIMINYIPNTKFTVKKDCYILFNFLNELFTVGRFKNCTFTWVSEAHLLKNSSMLKITKGKDFYRIKFIQNSDDHMAKFRNICPVCFCLSGSRNQKIANMFAIMLNETLSRDFN